MAHKRWWSAKIVMASFSCYLTEPLPPGEGVLGHYGHRWVFETPTLVLSTRLAAHKRSFLNLLRKIAAEWPRSIGGVFLRYPASMSSVHGIDSEPCRIYLSIASRLYYLLTLVTIENQINYLIKPLLMKNFGKYRLSCSAYFAQNVLEEVSSPFRWNQFNPRSRPR